MRWCLGIEIGGTKLQIGLGRGDGVLRSLWREEIDPGAGAGRIQQQILAGIHELLRQAHVDRGQVAGIGIGFGGPVDTERGLVTTSHQVGGWEQFPLVQWARVNLDLPAMLHNDADTAALAEAKFGAGQGFDPVMYVTVGSGIGGDLVCGGDIYRGSGQGALEIGHLRPGQRPLHVAQAGATVESIASGFGIEERARRVIADWGRTSLFVESRFQSAASPEREAQVARGEFGFPSERFATLLKLAGNDPAQVTTRLIARAAEQGDGLSRDLLADATSTIGWALAQAITLLNPGRIVIGGGVSLIGQEQFFEPVRRACRAETFKPFANAAEIVPAALGEEVVVHGALALARAAFIDEPDLRQFTPAEG